MTSSVIPKEKLSAYQRWELASLGEEQAAVANAQQDEEKLAQQREEARRQGHAEGFEQGRKAGLEAGRKEAAAEAARLRQLAEAFGSAVEQANDRVAEDLLNLALDLSKAMLKSALKVRPELVLPIVGDAIRYLPQVQQPALLILHPEDAKIVRSHMTDELEKAGWRVTEDVQMKRGGCRVETASNQIDAAIEGRWQRLVEALGRQSDWIE